MKEKIHPKYKKTSVRCACGAEYHVGSTAKDIHVGICAACHPFFTGKHKYVDTAGRVEKFEKRYGKGTTAKEATAKKATAAKKTAAKKSTAKKTAAKKTAAKKSAAKKTAAKKS